MLSATFLIRLKKLNQDTHLSCQRTLPAINLLQESGESHLLTVSFAMNNRFPVKCAMIVFIGFQVLLS